MTNTNSIVLNEEQIQPGDTVSTSAGNYALKMWPYAQCSVSDSSGWVVTNLPFRPSYQFRLEKGPKEPSNSYADNQVRWVDEHHITLERKGTGSFTPGIDLALSPNQARLGKLTAWHARARQSVIDRGTFEGWENPATWQANLLLTNDRSFVNSTLPGLRRLNGTINPKRIEKAFWCAKLHNDIEPWVYQPVCEVPAEYDRRHIPGLSMLTAINWASIALDMKEAPTKP